jgi:hypothetical protein
MKWAREVAHMKEMRNIYIYNIVVGKSEREKPLGRPRRRWEDNIGTDLREMVGKVWTDSSGSG